MKKLACQLVLLTLMATGLAGNCAADLVGDTYTLGITGFGDVAGHFLNIQNTFTVETFDGSGNAKVIGDSVFGATDGGGNALDEFVVIETFSVLSATLRQVTIDVVARNKSTLALTNWIADGKTTDGVLDTFYDTAIEIGDFNGGTDRLDDSIFESLISSNFRLIGTDANTYGSFSIDSPLKNGGLGGAAGVSLGSGADFATFEIAPGVEVAGYRVSYTYSVPEPGGLLAIAFGLTMLSLRPRNRAKKIT